MIDSGGLLINLALDVEPGDARLGRLAGSTLEYRLIDF